MPGTHEYEPDDVFYDVEEAADAEADAVLDEDKALRQAGFENVGGQHDEFGELLEDFNPEELI